MNKKFRQEIYNKVYKDWLCTQFPNCFNNSFRPLSIGIFDKLVVQLPKGISKTQLRRCIGWYTSRMAHFRAFNYYVFRVNPDGSDAEKISAYNKKHAYLRSIEISKKIGSP